MLPKYFHKNSVSVMVATDSIEKIYLQRGFKNIKKWSRGLISIISNRYLKKFNLKKNNFMCFKGLKRKNLRRIFNLDINAKKIMVGDGPMLNEYINKYPDVDFKDFYRKELKKAYCSADAFVFSKSLTIPFGLVVMKVFLVELL
ncbi:MAG: hypothetical protein CM15mP44_6450 [Candidatus Neomarinimicrobiota bacterium]|nr:MAG: hypothetical protein CM15mP44_6450 [Candidatus Neomarinimicrobiota bacterium]